MRPNTINQTYYRRKSHQVSFLIIAMALIASFILIASGSETYARTQDLDKLNRLVQASNSSEAATQVFSQARDSITDENWPRAEERFRSFINGYPNHKNVDAALYYLAFALSKREKLKEADERLNQLIADYPKSSWKDDAKALLIQIGAKQGTSPRAVPGR